MRACRQDQTLIQKMDKGNIRSLNTVLHREHATESINVYPKISLAFFSGI